MDIEYTKWKINLAAGFELMGDNFSAYGFCGALEFLEDDEMRNSLLLQEAIEGIEKEYTKMGYSFERRRLPLSESWIYRLWNRGELEHSTNRYLDIKEAKESAIRYVYDQEVREKDNGTI